MTAVGATNVGSIVINFDEQLKTNVRGGSTKEEVLETMAGKDETDDREEGEDKVGKKSEADERRYKEREWEGGVRVEKGEELGYFNFGSTIVLVFEAPVGFNTLNSNSRVKVGQGL